MQKSVMQQKPVSIAFPNSSGAKAFENIIGVLNGEENTGVAKKKGLAEAISSMFKNIHKKAED